ncbi:hypothetical protein FS749_001426 [Ceratobasidium sp. UAMH 11750]|nr:hypothetical protein FS749_001426 [Ceratobasidium sp. UAMH 11750]
MGNAAIHLRGHPFASKHARASNGPHPEVLAVAEKYGPCKPAKALVGRVEVPRSAEYNDPKNVFNIDAAAKDIGRHYNTQGIGAIRGKIGEDFVLAFRAGRCMDVANDLASLGL